MFTSPDNQIKQLELHIHDASKTDLLKKLKNVQAEIALTKDRLIEAKLDGDMTLIAGYNRRHKMNLRILDAILKKAEEAMGGEDADADKMD